MRQCYGTQRALSVRCLIVQSNFVELSYDTKYNVSLCQSVRNQRNVERSSKQNDEVKRATIDNNKNDGNRFITHSLFSLCQKLISTTVTPFLCLSCRTQTNSHAKQKVKNWKWWRSSVDLDRFKNWLNENKWELRMRSDKNNKYSKKSVIETSKAKKKKNGFDSDLDDILNHINLIDFIGRKIDIHHTTRCWRWWHFNNRTRRHRRMHVIAIATIADGSSHQNDRWHRHHRPMVNVGWKNNLWPLLQYWRSGWRWCGRWPWLLIRRLL